MKEKVFGPDRLAVAGDLKGVGVSFAEMKDVSIIVFS
jgi:hypothetical protein